MHYSQIFIKIRIFSSDEFPCKTEFSFFFLTGISNNLLVGNYKEKLRHEANFRGGGNRGEKKKMSKLPDGSFQENIPARVLRVQ